MKKLILIILSFLLMSSVVSAAPFIVCDPYLPTEMQPTSFVLIIDGGSPISVSPSSFTGGVGLILEYDVGGVAVGSHTVKIKACVTDSVWGEACSAEVPFVFTKPATPSLPKGISLSK